MEKLTHLNTVATAIFFKLIDGLMEQGACKTLDKHEYLPERKSGIMSVHIECIGENRHSVAHYFEQNGDLMSDPQMTFWVASGKVFPTSFTQHGAISIFQNAILFDEHNQPHSSRVNLLIELSEFVNDWMDNIKDQQDI